MIGKLFRGRRVVYAIGLVAIALTVALKLTEPPPLRVLSDLVFDTYQLLAPRPHGDAPVRIIDIDEESLAQLGQWPWPRSRVAELIERAAGFGAAAIALDIVFAEPDRTSPRRMVAELQRLGGKNGELPALDGLPDNDETLAETLGRLPVAAGMILTHDESIRQPRAKAGFAFAGADPRRYLPSHSAAVSNLSILEAKAPGLGFFSFEADRDRIIRRVPLIARIGDELYPALSLEALRLAQGASSIVIKSTGASGEANPTAREAMTALKIGAFEAQTTAQGELYAYYARPRADLTIPAWRVLAAEASDAALRQLLDGHIVFVGTGAPGLRDLVATPLTPSTPGVNVHAEVVDQILAGVFLARPDWAPGAELAVGLLLSLLMLIASPRFGALSCAVIGGAFVAAICAGSWYAFREHRFLFDPVYPSLAAGFVYLIVSGSLFFTSEQERRFVREAFGRYLAPALVDRLADDPSLLSLGGEDRELTILFCDVRGFTTVSEGLTPQALTSLVNGFLTPMTEVLLEHEATIDKYIGDSIMAFWNAPLGAPEHAAAACTAALAMVARLEALNREGALSTAAGRELRLHMGVGLNTGVCCVGNLGSAQRFSYSALGDAVNLASRIEGLTKHYGVAILVGEKTAAAASEMALLEADRVQVVGKNEAVSIYALLGDPSVAETPGFRALATHHRTMLEAYRARRWDTALAAIAAAEREAGSLGLEMIYKLYKTRIGAYQTSPPPPEWAGVSRSIQK